jgi:hypothetical protein
MLRKEVARRLHNWFDLGSPAITTALQTLAKPPLRLVRLVGNADSGREKKVILTARGQRFVASMGKRGQSLVLELISDLRKTLSDDQINAGMEFLRLSVSFFQRLYPRRGLKAKNLRNGDRARTQDAEGHGGLHPNRRRHSRDRGLIEDQL